MRLLRRASLAIATIAATVLGFAAPAHADWSHPLDNMTLITDVYGGSDFASMYGSVQFEPGFYTSAKDCEIQAWLTLGKDIGGEWDNPSTRASCWEGLTNHRGNGNVTHAYNSTNTTADYAIGNVCIRLFWGGENGNTQICSHHPSKTRIK